LRFGSTGNRELCHRIFQSSQQDVAILYLYIAATFLPPLTSLIIYTPSIHTPVENCSMDVYFRSLCDLSGKSPFGAPPEICIVDDNVRVGTIRVIVGSNQSKNSFKQKFIRNNRGIHSGREGRHGDDGSGSRTRSATGANRLENRFPLFRSMSMEITSSIAATSEWDGHHGTISSNGDGKSSTRRKSRWESVTNQATPMRNNSDSALGQPTRRSSVTEEELAKVATSIRWDLEDLEEEDSERNGWDLAMGERGLFKGCSSMFPTSKIRNIRSRPNEGANTPDNEDNANDATNIMVGDSPRSSNDGHNSLPPCQPTRKASSDSLSTVPAVPVEVAVAVEASTMPTGAVDFAVGAQSGTFGGAINPSSAPTLSSPSTMSTGNQSRYPPTQKRSPTPQGSSGLEIPESLRELPYKRDHPRLDSPISS
jgi:hypothetical protein